MVRLTEPNSSDGLTKFEPKAIRVSGLLNEFTIAIGFIALFSAKL